MKHAILLGTLLASSTTWAAAGITMNMVDARGVGASIGTVEMSDTKYGLVLTPDLHGLTAGAHGFHAHQFPNCEAKERDGKKVPALAAGEHLDPAMTKKHGAPWEEGHQGDLPALQVDAAGNATLPVLAPRLKAADLAGHSLIIHGGSEDYANHTEPPGGAGDRIACGVVRDGTRGS